MKVDIQRLCASDGIMKATERSVAAQREAEGQLVQERVRIQTEMARLENDQKLAAQKLQNEQHNMAVLMETEARQRRMRSEAEAAHYSTLRKSGMTEGFMIQQAQAEAFKLFAGNINHGTVFVPAELSRFVRVPGPVVTSETAF